MNNKEYDNELFLLENNLFNVNKIKNGVQTYININYLPNLLNCIKYHLNNKELNCIEDYKVQTYLIEVSLIKIKNSICIKKFIIEILEYIKSDKNFWRKSSDIWILLETDQNTVKVNEITAYDNYKEYIKNGEKIKNYLKNDNEILEKLFIKIDKIINNKKINNDLNEKKNYFLKKLFENKEKKVKTIKRRTRKEQRENEIYNFDRLFFKFNNNINELENDLDIDLTNIKKINYKNSPFINIKLYNNYKIKIEIIPKIFNYCLIYINKKINKKELNESEKFKFQNFLIYINSDFLENLKNTEIIKIKYINLKQYINDINYPNKNILLNFINYCNKIDFNIENYLDKLIIRKYYQLNFLINSLLIGIDYLTYKNKNLYEERFIKYTYSSSNDILIINNISLNNVLNNLEKKQNYSKFIRYNCIEYFIKEYEENDKTINDFIKINNFQNKKNIEINKKIDNISSDFLDYHNNEINLKKRNYIFNSDNRIIFSDDILLKLIKGIRKYYNIKINNKKITEFIGNDININHVKHLKKIYLKEVKNKKLKNNLKICDIIEYDINNFNRKLLFPNI